jgi:hypothetical protein
MRDAGTKDRTHYSAFCRDVDSSPLTDSGRLAELLEGLELWLEENEFESVEQLKGSMSQQSCPDPTAFERVTTCG